MPEEILYIFSRTTERRTRRGPIPQGIHEGDARSWKLTRKGGGWVQTGNRHKRQLDRLGWEDE